MSNKNIDLDLKMYYGTEDHKNASAWLVPAKTLHKFPTKEIKNIKEVDLFILSFDWDTSYDYISYFLKKHLNNNSKANIWAHNRYIKYQDEKFFDLAKDLKDIINYFSINEMFELIEDIRNTIKCLKESIKSEDTKKIYKYTTANHLELENLEQVKDQIIIFLMNFIEKLELMLKMAKEKHFDLIEWATA